MQIKDVMSQPALTCPVTGTLDHAARLMWEFDCGATPVIGDDGKVVGMVTDRDICMAAYTQGKPLREIPVTTAMATQPIVVTTEESFERTEELMKLHQIRRLPVLDEDGAPVGLVSMNDLARVADRSHKRGVDRELVETLACICQPRMKAMAIAQPSTMPDLAIAG